jgi:antitoxin MazE
MEVEMAISRIQKWGNSYGLRIPKNILDQMGLGPDTRFEIQQDQGKIIITPIKDPEADLEGLLEKITSENLHKEIDWGDSTGKEGG